MKLGIIYKNYHEVEEIICKLENMKTIRYEMKDIYTGFINDNEVYLLDSSDSIPNLSIESHLFINDFNISYIIIVGTSDALINSVYLSDIVNLDLNSSAYFNPNISSGLNSNNYAHISVCKNLHYDYSNVSKKKVLYNCDIKNTNFNKLCYINEIPFISSLVEDNNQIINSSSFLTIKRINNILHNIILN